MAPSTPGFYAVTMSMALEDENCMLHEQFGNQRLHLNGDERRHLAVKAEKLCEWCFGAS